MPNHKPQRCTSGFVAMLKRADHGNRVLQSEVDAPCCRSQELLRSQQALPPRSGKASSPAAAGSALHYCPADRPQLRQNEALRPVGIAPIAQQQQKGRTLQPAAANRSPRTW